MTDVQVTTVRTTNFFTDVKTLVNTLLAELQGLDVSIVNVPISATIQDVPCVLTFGLSHPSDNPEFPSYVAIVAPEDESAGGVNCKLPIEWLA